MGFKPAAVISQSRPRSVGSRACVNRSFGSIASQWFLRGERCDSPPLVSIFQSPEPVSRKYTCPILSTRIPDPGCANAEATSIQTAAILRSVLPIVCMFPPLTRTMENHWFFHFPPQLWKTERIRHVLGLAFPVEPMGKLLFRRTLEAFDPKHLSTLSRYLIQYMRFCGYSVQLHLALSLKRNSDSRK